MGVAAEPEAVDWDDGSGRSSFVAQLADRLRETDDHDHMLRNTVKGAPAEVGRLLEWLIADGRGRAVMI